ncbi:MAG: FmdB family transcriptional regulator [Dehalococcoidia bacterium]|nr:FmdB family transcriptional regulator [Dehalococcoidia bacterium]
MPIYSYYCDSCDKEFDLRQGFDAVTEADCASCGNPARRKFVAPTVIYKGSGFYTTDYARKSGGSSSATPSSSEQTTAAKGTEKKSTSTNTENKSTSTNTENKSTKSTSSSDSS